jgi:hypothetical protein
MCDALTGSSGMSGDFSFNKGGARVLTGRTPFVMVQSNLVNLQCWIDNRWRFTEALTGLTATHRDYGLWILVLV